MTRDGQDASRRRPSAAAARLRPSRLLAVLSGRGAFAATAAVALLLPLLLLASAAAWTWHALGRENDAELGHGARLLREHALRAFEAQEGLLAAVAERARGLDWAAPEPSLTGFLHAMDEVVPSAGGLTLISPGGVAVLAGRPPPAGGYAWSRLPATASEPGGVAPRPSAGPVSNPASNPASDPAGARAASRLLFDENGARRPRDAEPLPRFALGRPTRSRDGRDDGGRVVAAFQPSYFESFYASLVRGRKDVALLLRADGALLASWPPVEAGRLPPASPLLPALGRAADGEVAEVTEAAAANAGANAGSASRRYAVQRVGDYPAYVAYGRDDCWRWHSWLSRLLPAALLSALGAAALIGLAALATRDARREVERLRRDADEAQAVAAAAARESGGLRREAEGLARLREAAEGRAALQARLRQAEKVAVLGQLSAGLAHDFGNLVQSVRSGLRLIECHADEPDKVRRYAVMVGEAAERGQVLTRRLTDFARREEAVADARFDPAQSLPAVCEMLAHTLGGHWPLRQRLLPGTGPVAAERAEFETVLVNLVVNARDASPAGGPILVDGRAERLPEEAGREPEPGPTAGGAPERAGLFFRLDVRDRGQGMDADTLARAGETFFTTKPAGQGTGLGLSMARDFAERSGGALRLRSRPGEGTEVSLWLPFAASEPDAAPGDALGV